MPEMKSPDGTETISVPTDEGVRVLKALGWTGGTTRSAPASADTEDRPRRGPGRPRKNPPAEG